MTIEEAKIVLAKEYHIDNFTYLAKDVLLPDYAGDVHDVWFKNDIFSTVKQLGTSEACELTVFEVYLKEGTHNRRVAITQEMFKILRGLHINNALVAFVNANEKNFRISLLTSKYEFNGDKIVKVLSNPRRFSYTLGIGMKTKTAYKFLIEKGKVKDLNELIGRFSVEVVNKQFYAEIATAFTELVGGERNGKTYEKLLRLYGSLDHNKHAEFGVRLIGRIMFCWFLREKRSVSGVPLVPDDMLSTATIDGSNNYYHQVLEPLFFELLNTPINSRKRDFDTDYYNKIPYLNGGLFSPHTDDMYRYDPILHGGRYGQVTIPNEWFKQLYQTLGQYNFTVDENTAYDIELSIDPEMLGRIFENLLAEINPETGENAKKSTGSFYTPRDIVDYMVDSSLCEYLKTKTGIDEVKLKALISYSKDDAELAVFTAVEKKKLIEALYTVTVLDPACGSGAFPIGMLQKIVYILQEVDPGADLWFDEMVKGAPIYVRQAFEKKFRNGELDYLRKITVIERSIYGIDIQPIAVEISRLRCFLSLIIEEKVDDTEYNRNIKPLPNLDFKFIIANSLIPLEKNVAKSFLKNKNGAPIMESQMSLFEEINHIDKLKEIREEFFTADATRRAELKSEFQSLQQDMLIRTIQNSKLSTKEYEQLSQWKPFENKATDWFDPEWMFGIKDGFDIIIANPPYGADIDNLTGFYKKIYPETTKGFKDIYKLFFDLAINHLVKKQLGVVSFITPNTYLSQPRYKDLRTVLLKTNLINIVNLGFNMFTATVPTAITLLMHRIKDDNHILINDISQLSSIEEKVSNINCGIFIEQNTIIRNTNYNFLEALSNSDEKNILTLERIVKFKDAGINYQRVNVGLQQKGKSDLSKRLLYEGLKEKEADVEYWKGEDIGQFSINSHTGRYVRLNIPLAENERVIINTKYFNIAPKLIWRQTAQYPVCVVDDVGRYFGRSIQAALINEDYSDKVSYKYLCCVLNSNYIRYLYDQKVHETGRVFPQVKLENLRSLPIIIPEKKVMLEIEEIYDKLFNKDDKKDLLIKLNSLVYSLYGLSTDEIARIEGTVE